MSEPTQASTFSRMSDYEICSLYCDYYEWLTNPVTGPREVATQTKYLSKMGEAMRAIAERYKEDV